METQTVTLTANEWDLLDDLTISGGSWYSPERRYVTKAMFENLVAAGYAIQTRVKGTTSFLYEITEAGREALLDRTQEFTPIVIADETEPVLCTRPIELSELHDLNQLAGGLYAYRLNAASEWQTGNILSVKDTRFGYQVLFQPKNKNLTVKHRPLNEIVHAWYSTGAE